MDDGLSDLSRLVGGGLAVAHELRLQELSALRNGSILVSLSQDIPPAR